MSEISKQALKVDNNTSFPNNNTGYISPTILRAFNVNMIDSLVDEITFTAFSGSVTSSIQQLSAFTASQQPSFTSLNAFTASQAIVNTNLNQFTQSANASISKLDTFSSSFNAYTASINQIRSNGVTLGTSTIFNLVGPGTFFSASLVQNIQGNIATLTFTSDNGKVNTSSFNEYTASTAATQSVFSASVATSFSSSNATFNTFSASQNNFNLSATASLQELLNLSSSLSGGYATQGELDYSASILQGNIDSLAVSQAISNSYFATTGSNTFRGIETFEDAGGNATSLVPVSGSLMLVAKGFTSASAHLTSSANSFVNLIFKNNNITSDTIISGSNNIFTNPTLAGTGFKRYIGSNNIFIHSGSVPQITGSTAYPLTIDNNFSNRGVISVAGPISASASGIQFNFLSAGGISIGSSGVNNAEKLVGGFTINSNLVLAGTPTIIANQNFITGSATITNNQFITSPTIAVSSSAVTIQGNLFNAGLNVRNAYWSSSIGLGNLSVARNIMQGSTHIVLFTGSLPAGVTNQPQMAESQLMGTNLTAFVDVSGSDVAGTTANHTILSTMIHGHNTIVTGSSASTLNNFGSAFFGRYNAQDGNRSKTAQTIFAVGTGNSTTRKTGFLIDSGSNTFVEGTLNVSGSLSFTGSVYGNVSASAIASSTASIDLNVANYFTLTLSGSTNINVLNPKPGVTATLVINTDTGATASFSNNVKQPSGSAYVASPSGNIDIISFTSVNSTTVYAFPAQSFV